MLAIALSFGAFAQETPPKKDTIPTEKKTQLKDINIYFRNMLQLLATSN